MKDILMAVSLYNPSICLHVNGTFVHMQVTHALCTPKPWQMFAFTSVADESLDGPFGLWDWELEIHFFSWKQVEMWTHLSTAHIFTVFLTIWDELWPREPSSIAAYNWFLVFS